MKENSIYYFGLILFILFLVILLILYKLKKQSNKKSLIKIKYLNDINGMLGLAILKEKVHFNTLLTKLDQLKQMIEITNFDLNIRVHDIDQNINIQFEEIYEILKFNQFDLNQVYLKIENIIRLINKRTLLLNSKSTKKKQIKVRK